MESGGHPRNPRRVCPKCGASFLGKDCPACAAYKNVAAGATFLSPGQSLREFEVVEILGRGGMGVVYKARQPSLHRFVALKVLPPEKASLPGFEPRFEREAQALAALTHPNIVGVHDFGKEGLFYFMALEYVEGRSLQELLRERALSRREVLRFLDQICDALEFAHRAGVVHRDIKPGNILVGQLGVLKICDFGLAKLLDPSTPSMTMSGAALGTVHYMAPEQMENAQGADHRADIYSTGVLAYEMLSGRLPREPYDPPSRSALQRDLNLDRPVGRALSKNPADRYASMAEFKADIHRAAKGRRTPRLWIALVAVSLILGAGAVLGWKWTRKPAPPSAPSAVSPPRRKLVREFNEGGAAVVFAPDRSFVAAASGKSVELYGNPVRTFAGRAAWVTAVAVRPDGQVLASGGDDGTIQLWNIADGREIRNCEGHKEHVLCLAFSPDAGMLASGDAAGIVKLWDASGGKSLCDLQDMVFSLAFRPDGRMLAVGTDGGTIRLYDLAARKEVGALDAEKGAVRSLAFRADGRMLASGSEKGKIQLWNVEERKLHRELPGHAQAVCAVAFDPKGKRLASGSRDGTAKTWDLERGIELQTFQSKTGWVVAVTFREDGSFIFAEGYGARIGTTQ